MVKIMANSEYPHLNLPECVVTFFLTWSGRCAHG